MINIVVVTTINGLYVAAVRSDYDSSIMITISFAMSVFKLVWNYILINGSFNKRIEELELVLTKEALSLLCLFNNLIAPFLAESLFSSDCFLYVFSDCCLIIRTIHAMRLLLMAVHILFVILMLKHTSKLPNR